MSVLLGSLTLVVLLLWRWDAQKVDRERLAWTEERKELLSRIQHPERVPVAPMDYDPPEVPQDAQEEAWVGMEVPDFVKVGSE